MRDCVLIAYDMKENIDILMYALQDNYRILSAHNGETAMRILEHDKPGLVLLDVTGPGSSGFDVLRFIKGHEEWASIPVIIITAVYDLVSEEKCLSMGAADYIRKPFNMSIVKIKVKNHLELKKYRDNLEHMVMERTRQLTASREAIIMSMSYLCESRDHVTGQHINRIKEYTRVLTQRFMECYPDLMTPKEAELIVLFSPLHDVGKTGVPDDVLNKPAELTAEEMTLMKTHARAGMDILSKSAPYLTDDNKEFKVAMEIAQCHHEKFDGSGYPNHLRGDEIPLAARIVSLADVYDALRSPRPYKPPYSHEDTMHVIFVGDGRTQPSHFDPMVLSVFQQVHTAFEKIYNNENKGDNI